MQAQVLLKFQFVVAESATGFEEESSIVIEPDANAIMKLSVFIGNPNFNDVLELRLSGE